MAEDADSLSRDFSDRLRKMGVAQPNPTYSPSSTASVEIGLPPGGPPANLHTPLAGNRTLNVLTSRRRLQEQADAEFDGLGRRGSEGREFLDPSTINQALSMRENGASPEAIEKRLRLKPGVVARLGRLGIAAPVNMAE